MEHSQDVAALHSVITPAREEVVRFYSKELCVFDDQHFLNLRLQRELGKIQASVLRFFWEKGTDLSGKTTFFNFK